MIFSWLLSVVLLGLTVAVWPCHFQHSLVFRPCCPTVRIIWSQVPQRVSHIFVEFGLFGWKARGFLKNLVGVSHCNFENSPQTADLLVTKFSFMDISLMVKHNLSTGALTTLPWFMTCMQNDSFYSSNWVFCQLGRGKTTHLQFYHALVQPCVNAEGIWHWFL